jgi:hypothetical protein
MEKSAATIDLHLYRTPGSRVFTNRSTGIEVRISSRIDFIESQYESITLVIPDDISSINPSFLEEFFKNVVVKLGEHRFRQKFSFINNGRYKIDFDLNEAIERILLIQKIVVSL